MLKIGFAFCLFLFSAFNLLSQSSSDSIGRLSIDVTVKHQEGLLVSKIIVKNTNEEWEEEIFQLEDGEYVIGEKKLILEEDFFWRGVRDVTISMVSDRHLFSSPKNTVQLDSLKILQDLPIAFLENLKINLNNYYGKVAVNFSRWERYEEWKSHQLLHSFKLESSVMNPGFSIADLYGFNINELSVPLLLNDELLQFPQLESIEAYGILSNPTQQLFQLKKLKTVSEYGTRYNNSFETMHAQRHYDNLRYVTTFPKHQAVRSHALDLLVEYGIEQADVVTTDKSYELLLYENDLDFYSGHTPENDTLLSARFKRSKRKGVWTFKLKNQYPRNDKEKHKIDFKNLPKLKTPENGLWMLPYSNGNIAMEGAFVNGKKNGEWKFYHEDGTIESTRTYANDTLKLNIIQFELNGNVLESRIYYESEDRLYQSIQYADGNLRLNGFDYNIPGTYCFSINQKGCMELKWSEFYNVHCSFQNGKEFDDLIKRPMLDKLFPEYIGMKFPIKIIR